MWKVRGDASTRDLMAGIEALRTEILGNGSKSTTQKSNSAILRYFEVRQVQWILVNCNGAAAMRLIDCREGWAGWRWLLKSGQAGKTPDGLKLRLISHSSKRLNSGLLSRSKLQI